LWFFVVMLLPENHTTPELAETIIADLKTTCEELGVTLGGGHTEITQGLDRVRSKNSNERQFVC
jgi:hydrogenase maturation factor